MALSNYLFQSVVGVLLFYGIGGGLFIHVSLVTSLLIALAISSVLRFRDLVRLVGLSISPSIRASAPTGQPNEALWCGCTHMKPVGPHVMAMLTTTPVTHREGSGAVKRLCYLGSRRTPFRMLESRTSNTTFGCLRWRVDRSHVAESFASISRRSAGERRFHFTSETTRVGCS